MAGLRRRVPIAQEPPLTGQPLAELDGAARPLVGDQELGPKIVQLIRMDPVRVVESVCPRMNRTSPWESSKLSGALATFSAAMSRSWVFNGDHGMGLIRQ